MIRLSLCPFVEKNTRMWGKCYPPKWGINLFAKGDGFAIQYKKKLSLHLETVCLLSNRKLKPDTYIKLSLDMEDYYRIKDAEKEKNKTS